jgi:hypothetical protein
MKDKTIRGIDDDLYRWVRVSAAERGITVGEVINDAIRISQGKITTPALKASKVPIVRAPMIPGETEDERIARIEKEAALYETRFELPRKYTLEELYARDEEITRKVESGEPLPDEGRW